MCIFIVNPVYEGHSREPADLSLLFKLKSYTLLINGQYETGLYRQ